MRLKSLMWRFGSLSLSPGDHQMAIDSHIVDRLLMIPIVLMALLLSLTLLSGQGLAESPGAALERAGWAAIRNGKLEEASRLFAEAIAARPDDAALRLGAGLVEHLQGREGQARKDLEDALRLDP